jgi:hypothetical protein
LLKSVDTGEDRDHRPDGYFKDCGGISLFRLDLFDRRSAGSGACSGVASGTCSGTGSGVATGTCCGGASGACCGWDQFQ